MKKIIRANIEILDGHYRVKQGKIREGDYIYSEGYYDYDYMHWFLIDEDYIGDSVKDYDIVIRPIKNTRSTNPIIW